MEEGLSMGITILVPLLGCRRMAENEAQFLVVSWSVLKEVGSGN